MKWEIMKKNKVIYYNDELNDEFSTAVIEPRIIDERYNYKHSFIWECFSALLQNVLSVPIKWIYLKCKFRHKFISKEKYRECKNTGFFIYSNHTQVFSDTFTTSMSVMPKRNYLIVNPANISVKPFGWIVELLGAIPIPGNLTATKNFMSIIEDRVVNKRQSITIYPEAHIWPYYTGIRNFKDVSFTYPIKFNKPVFCVTNTYQKIDNSSKVRMVSYIDGPFYPDINLSKKEAQKKIRNIVYEKMLERAKNSNVEVVKYIKNIDNFSNMNDNSNV
jgi:acyltransferase